MCVCSLCYCAPSPRWNNTTLHFQITNDSKTSRGKQKQTLQSAPAKPAATGSAVTAPRLRSPAADTAHKETQLSASYRQEPKPEMLIPISSSSSPVLFWPYSKGALGQEAATPSCPQPSTPSCVCQSPWCLRDILWHALLLWLVISAAPAVAIVTGCTKGTSGCWSCTSYHQ